MKSGIVGKVEGTFDQIDTARFPETSVDGKSTVKSTLSIDSVRGHGPKDVTMFGSAAREVTTETVTSVIGDDGDIVETDAQMRVETSATEFICIPGEFVVVESSKKQFAFDLIERTTSASIERVTFDLDSFLGSHPEAGVWMAGFYDHDGGVDSGVVYGEELVSDPATRSLLESARKNQLGVTIEYESSPLRALVTESGYLRVYEPCEFDSLEFARLIREELFQHVVSEPVTGSS